MSGVLGVLSYGIGTILGLILVGLMLFWFVLNIT
jgi:plastocyanin domain-containing protein